MKSQAQLKSAIVDLAGPLPESATVVQADTARRTLSWCLGQYGDKPFAEAVLGVKTPSAPPSPPPA